MDPLGSSGRGEPQQFKESAENAHRAPKEEGELIAALRRRDERAFEQLIDLYGPSLARMARHYVRSSASAEEVVQETWLGVLKGIDRFEERSSLKTWVFRILMNCARTRGQREARSVPFSELAERELGADMTPVVDPGRFQGSGEQYPDHWDRAPKSWGDQPMYRLLNAESTQVIHRAIHGLPQVQREVMTLRDIEGLSSDSVCELLQLSEANQRVLLHRARSKVRSALETYFGGEN